MAALRAADSGAQGRWLRLRPGATSLCLARPGRAADRCLGRGGVRGTCRALELPSALSRGAVALRPAAAQGAVERAGAAGAVDSSGTGAVDGREVESTSNVASRVFLLCLSIGKRSTGTQREGGMGGFAGAGPGCGSAQRHQRGPTRGASQQEPARDTSHRSTLRSTGRRRWPRVRQRRGAGGQQRRFAHAERRRAAGAGLVGRNPAAGLLGMWLAKPGGEADPAARAAARRMLQCGGPGRSIPRFLQGILPSPWSWTGVKAEL
mmetsp:Transcript_35490/g.76778  ORF Transcript_35490/g.76778 Transcript_35490/m.76778 type:complete len:264 (+) Transcript_35490:1046-1837(+)